MELQIGHKHDPILLSSSRIFSSIQFIFTMGMTITSEIFTLFGISHFYSSAKTLFAAHNKHVCQLKSAVWR